MHRSTVLYCRIKCFIVSGLKQEVGFFCLFGFLVVCFCLVLVGLFVWSVGGGFGLVWFSYVDSV